MARNEQRRQKKLAERKSKRNEEQRAVTRMHSSGLREQMEAAQHWPVIQSRVASRLWEHGIGEALLVRRGPGGVTAYALFLLDVYCLGVKNVIAHAAPIDVAANWLSGVHERSGPWTDVSPEHVRKLVEESVGYALSLGLAPHRDCPAALLIFGKLDSSQCAKQFAFGRKGKPMYVAGPHDSESRIREILGTLTRTCGPDGFHYLIPVATPELTREIDELIDRSRGRVIDLHDEPHNGLGEHDSSELQLQKRIAVSESQADGVER